MMEVLIRYTNGAEIAAMLYLGTAIMVEAAALAGMDNVESIEILSVQPWRSR